MDDLRGQDVIDSRDIIERLEELETDRSIAEDESRTALLDFDDEYGEELEALKALENDANCSPDWIHGEVLINESYFTDYIEELIKDCYEMPSEIDSGQWPYRHMTMDYDSAADEAKIDYIEVDFDGSTYYIRA
jgi:hypothetical protein